MTKQTLTMAFSIFLSTACFGQSASAPRVGVGIDDLSSHSALFAGKRVSIVSNHTGRDSASVPIHELFTKLPGTKVTALFSPEHGFAGKAEAGDKVGDQIGQDGQIPIYSLFGQTRKPTDAMLKNVDVLVFDIQDIGVRFYTYISTMSVCMEAAAEKGIPFVVLDRPNPINGRTVEGPLLDRKFRGFLGPHPIPARYGLTMGELARLVNRQGWLKDGIKADLTVVPLRNWKRSMYWDQTGLTYIAPSPNIRSPLAALAYVGTCLIEGTNVSEGRGADQPFLQFGAPWIRVEELAHKLNALSLPGVCFHPVMFKPTASKYQDQDCFGCRMVITDRDVFESFWTGVKIIETLFQSYPNDFRFKADHFDHLCGTDRIRLAIEQRRDLSPLRKQWQDQADEFQKLCKPILLYE